MNKYLYLKESVLPYGKLVSGQFQELTIELSPQECKDLVNLVSALLEENRRLLLQATQVSKDLRSMYGTGGANAEYSDNA